MKDLVIVGGGPIGCKLAEAISKRSPGLDISILEKNRVGEPLACSGHVSRDIWRFLPDGSKEELVQNEIRGARFHVDGESYEFYKDETVSWAIDRVEMDRSLADSAREKDIDIEEGVEVRGVEMENDVCTVETDNSLFESRFVAGCDGPRSVVRREMDFDEPDRLLKGVLGFSDEPDHSDFVDVYLDIPGFFGWRIPRGDAGVEYGAAADSNPRGWLDDVVLDEWSGVDICDVCAGQIPIGSPDSTVSERVFLVGDAAGQVKPFTGGGLVYGLSAAEIATNYIEPGNPDLLSSYDSAWRDKLRRDIWLGEVIRRMYDWPDLVQKIGLGMFQGEIYVHMDKPTSLFNKKTANKLIKNISGFGR